jgi:hypothetical protein
MAPLEIPIALQRFRDLIKSPIFLLMLVLTAITACSDAGSRNPPVALKKQ